ncbi:MAG: tyrosine--tRNA ligase [Planctomycetota bacterium]|nr:tyrosine--tRNA ligase [Planctomycetota bacterium]
MSGFLETLERRGFLNQTTDRQPLEELLSSGERVTAYVGVDPTAASCHVGHLLPIMGLVHLQRAGHRPVLLVGGGTGRIGDPSGKTEMRKLLPDEAIDANVRAIRDQLSRHLELGEPGVTQSEGNSGLVLDNADWLLGLNYVDFLRDVGRHFSVNRMLAAESVKLRLESDAGLSFLEFNYSLLQAYDFLVLNQRYGCQLQLGGSDQWGNIVAGIELIRRVEGRAAHGITFSLITTASGSKMGKTEAGAVWLDPNLTPPYEYYQFWINTEDGDVGRFLRLFTLLPLEEVEALERLQGADLRRAKETLAFEATALTHGADRAEEARQASRALFGGDRSAGGDAVPTHTVPEKDLREGIPVFVLFDESGLCESRSAARRMARQRGLYVNGEVVAEERVVGVDDFEDGTILLRAGKKRYCRVIVEA